MMRQIKTLGVFLVGLAAVACLLALVPAQGNGGGKPAPSIRLKAAFVPILDASFNHLEKIRNGVGIYEFLHQGEGTSDVHIRILEPDQYGPLQMYIPKASGFWVEVLCSWPPETYPIPDTARCGWPPFLLMRAPGEPGEDVYAAETFVFKTGAMLQADTSNPPVLSKTDDYLNFSQMGVGGYPSVAIAESTIKVYDGTSRQYWLENGCPVRVVATLSDAGLPVAWTITPVTESYAGWLRPGVRELGAPRIKSKASGEWWCSFGEWDMPFVLHLERL